MRKLAVIWLVLLLGFLACTDGEESTPTAGKFGATCATVVDTGSTECESGVCTDAFDMIGHPVCSVKCTAPDATGCPNGADGTMKCNMKGYCKP